MKKVYQITAAGRKDLENELEELKGRRGTIADKIAAARDYGDLTENAEYDTARSEQGLVETRIAEIEDILNNAEEIKVTRAKGVHLGHTVTLESAGKEVSYTIVGAVEADPVEGKISDESPIGKALMGKQVGDTVVIETPKGSNEYVVKALS